MTITNEFCRKCLFHIRAVLSQADMTSAAVDVEEYVKMQMAAALAEDIAKRLPITRERGEPPCESFIFDLKAYVFTEDELVDYTCLARKEASAERDEAQVIAWKAIEQRDALTRVIDRCYGDPERMHREAGELRDLIATQSAEPTK